LFTGYWIKSGSKANLWLGVSKLYGPFIRKVKWCHAEIIQS
jgi:hypothetical protein